MTATLSLLNAASMSIKSFMNNENFPLISVITVVYNNAKGLERTIRSSINQNYKNFELLIIDGGSKDDTVDIIKKYSDHVSYWVSEKDNGIYDAMNKGIEAAKGQWLNFMNSGDEFFDNNVLQDISNYLNDLVNLVYGDKYYSSDIIKANYINNLDLGGIMACHQSMFFRKLDIRYDLRYKIYSDYDFVCQYYLLNRKSIKKIDRVISLFESGGVSNKPSWQKRFDKYHSVYNRFGVLALVKSVINRVRLFFMVNRSLHENNNE